MNNFLNIFCGSHLLTFVQFFLTSVYVENSCIHQDPYTCASMSSHLKLFFPL
jgi:hypothetical protein